MAASNIGRTPQGAVIYFGTDAERQAMTDIVDAGKRQFWLIDGSRYESDGSGRWRQTHGADSVPRVSPVNALPNGVLVAQPAIAAAVGNGNLVFSSPAKGVRLTLSDGTTVTPNFYANVCFDAPTDGIRDDWLNETLNGPRHRINVDGSLELTFLNADGTQATVSKMGYDFVNNPGTGGSLAVEIVI